MIHQFSLNGYNIVLDVNSGAVHVLDDLAYELTTKIAPPLSEECPSDIIESMCGRYAADDIVETYQELVNLYHQGLLFSSDDYAEFAEKMISSPIKAMCLHIAHDCNLRCEYCFAAKGDFGHGRTLMSLEVGKAAIDFLLKYSGTRRNLELDFFGGEPLMNFDVVREIVLYARAKEQENGKNFRFTVTTNGLLLSDDKIDFINREMSNVVLSIDGRPEVNDRLRTRVDGSGCYNDILPKYKKLVDLRRHDQYYVRGTFTKYNLDFAEDVLHLEKEGFKQISVEPVVSDAALSYSIREDDLPAVFNEYERLAQIIIEKKEKGENFNFFHFMLDLEQGPCAIKRLRGCGCGNEYVAVTPEGDIYPCHQFVGMDGQKMGSILADDCLDLRVKEKFAGANIYGKPDCIDCWAKFYCSGGCNANNLQYEGNIFKSHKLSCDLEKKRLECALMIKAAAAQ